MSQNLSRGSDTLVNGAPMVIGNQQTAVGKLDDVNRTTQHMVVFFQPAVGKHRFRNRFALPEADQHDPIAMGLRPVPGSVQRHQHLPPERSGN